MVTQAPFGIGKDSYCRREPESCSVRASENATSVQPERNQSIGQLELTNPLKKAPTFVYERLVMVEFGVAGHRVEPSPNQSAL
jgi:hypothetical protein